MLSFYYYYATSKHTQYIAHVISKILKWHSLLWLKEKQMMFYCNHYHFSFYSLKKFATKKLTKISSFMGKLSVKIEDL